VENEVIDYGEYIESPEEVRDTIQIAIDNLSNDDIANKLTVAQKIAIHSFVRTRFAYCKRYGDGLIYTPDCCNPDKVFELIRREKSIDAEDSAVFGYVCCVIRDAINDYYRNLERFRKDKSLCTEDWKQSGMTEEEFTHFYSKRALLPRRIIKRSV